MKRPTQAGGGRGYRAAATASMAVSLRTGRTLERAAVTVCPPPGGHHAVPRMEDSSGPIVVVGRPEGAVLVALEGDDAGGVALLEVAIVDRLVFGTELLD